MSKGINLTDPGVWDDSALVDSWNEALKEYNKYHSIHAQGKDLEDVLTDEELAQLRMERRAQRKGHNEPAKADANDDAELPDVELCFDEQGKLIVEEPVTTGDSNQQHPAQNGASRAVAQTPVPHALMAGIQDESMKNLMMSWYYAGYYTGLHDGQQQSKPAPNGGSGG